MASPPSPAVRPPARALAWWDARRSGRSILLAWIVTRLLVVVLLASAERLVVGDVFYYRRKIGTLLGVGLPQTLNEYPTPVVWLLSIPYGLGGGTRVGYLITFVVLMMLLDAAFAWALWRSAGRRHGRSLDFWVLYPFLVGPLCYTRFDMVPAVLAGGALLVLYRRPGLAGALTGIGAAIKLWPALLVAAVAAPRGGRGRVLAGFALVGFGLAALSLAIGGRVRLFSPLTWQSGRGLQIESVWATPLMVARMLHPQGWQVQYSRFQAYEVFGPGVTALLTISTVATVVGLVVIGGLGLRAFRRGDALSPVAVGLLVLAIVAVMTITNKTLSPQYLLWLGGPAAALLVLRRAVTAPEQRMITRLARQLLALAVLTHLVYPLLYNGLLGRGSPSLLVAATVVTTLRNVAVVLFTVEVCRFAWVSLRSANRIAVSPPGGAPEQGELG